jgi:hypothetical protein
MNEFTYKYSEWIVGIALVLLVAAAVIVAVIDSIEGAKAKKSFMHQCMKDHKEYECIAMWRAGENKTSYVPMPIIIPSTR